MVEIDKIQLSINASANRSRMAVLLYGRLRQWMDKLIPLQRSAEEFERREYERMRN